MTCAIIKFESELPETIRTLLPKHQSYSLTVRQDGDNLYVLVSDYSLLNTHSCYIYQKIVYNPAREEVIEKDNFKQVEEIGQIIFNACCNDPCTWSNLRERLYNFWRKKFWRDRRKTKEFEALNQRFRQKNDWEEHEKNRKDRDCCNRENKEADVSIFFVEEHFSIIYDIIEKTIRPANSLPKKTREF